MENDLGGSKANRYILYIPWNIHVCFAVVISTFLVGACDTLSHIPHAYSTGTGTIIRIIQCHWSYPGTWLKLLSNGQQHRRVNLAHMSWGAVYMNHTVLFSPRLFHHFWDLLKGRVPRSIEASTSVAGCQDDLLLALHISIWTILCFQR